MNNITKIQKISNLLIQAAIFLATCLYLYRQVFHKADVVAIAAAVGDEMSKPVFAAGIAAVLLLMFVNWGAESVKWRYLIGKVERISFFKAFQAVLTGVSVSSVIPNRVGEFLGRIYFLDKTGRIEGIFITVIGSMSQLLVTVVAGSAGLLIFIPRFFPGEGFSGGYLYHSLAALVVTLDLLLLGLFFRISFLAALKERILKNGLRRLQRFFRVFAFYNNRGLAFVLLLSALRYLAFSTQFYILLTLFGAVIPYPDAMALITVIYLVMAVIPTITLTELGVRGSVSVYVFGIWFAQASLSAGGQNTAILAATTLLWMINLGLPALAGAFFVYRLKFFRKEAG